VNADDWGCDQAVTDQTLRCILHGSVSSVSTMVFMEDSERAAAISQEREIDAGLHLNFTSAFSARHIPELLLQHQQRITRYLRRQRFAQVVIHPGLASSFEYVVAAQLDEYRRLYGAEPERLDGHHHMHLCANVLWEGLLPIGTIVRRNFSFQPGEKGFFKRFYRKFIDCRLAKRHRLGDFFFALAPVDSMDRLQRIFSLACQYVVEVETHAIKPEEYRFLTCDEFFRVAGQRPVAPRFALAATRQTQN
jgi:hypothetical protein